jgi:putative nucleotidyltransferase with HDIG domain
LVGALVSELLEIGFAVVTTAVRGGPARETARTLLPLLVLAPPIYAPIVGLLAIMYVEVSPWTLALFLVPAIAAQRLYALYQQERQLAADLSTANETLERANLQFAAALIATLDARDRYTAGHSAAVAIYTRDIAERMGLPVEVQDHAYLCGLVHDIGKIGLPPGLLEKPGALTLEERRQMQEHSAIGERILAYVDEYSEIATVVRHHHERIDGQGYPDGLADEEIPLVSRIIAVADAYNAMTSDRPYRDAMPSRVARLRLAQAVDSQFDTSVVAAFEAILAGAAEDYRIAKRRDFLEFAQSSDDPRPDSVPSIAEVA